eukprot:TRINITY_DN4098_c0_g3_i2.p1 TRINITY_DN4098_c0_g3~~TRINITY_DN4098_c0_g3_i2.p1  ORF type:complete len:248 (-),score=28.48 TRINITY_DN4098_c0_g3_i2:223-966(-)
MGREQSKTQQEMRSPPSSTKSHDWSEQSRKILDQPYSPPKVCKNKMELCKEITKWITVEQQQYPCPVCLESLTTSVVQLSECNHCFHSECITLCIKENSQFLLCPCCLKVYGTRTGTMPRGTRTVTRSTSRLEGYSCGTIVINYHFPDGLQGPEHPQPGAMYTGTSRTAYLPDDEKGNEVLRLLDIAWERKLTFTVGTSVTTGTSNSVVWNGIHHKTAMSGGTSNYGYPDDTYLDRVKAELNDLGIF